MPFFTKKPVTIEAIQWYGSNTSEIIAFTKGGVREARKGIILWWDKVVGSGNFYTTRDLHDLYLESLNKKQ